MTDNDSDIDDHQNITKNQDQNINLKDVKKLFDEYKDQEDGLISIDKLLNILQKKLKMITINSLFQQNIVEKDKKLDFTNFLFVYTVSFVLEHKKDVDIKVLKELKDSVFESVIRLNSDTLRTEMRKYKIEFIGDLEKMTDICSTKDHYDDVLENDEQFRMQISELKEAFDLCHYKKDDNEGKGDNGVISKQELEVAMKSFRQNLSNDELTACIAEADANDDNGIDFPEFVLIFKRLLGKPMKNDKKKTFDDETQELIKKLFTDNHLDASKLKNEMSKLGVELDLEKLKIIIKEADINNDGKFDTEEFLEMMSADARWVLSSSSTDTKY